MVRKRLSIAGIVLVLILISFGVWNGMRTREPRYMGKPLSFWLEGRGCTEAEAKEAVDHLGTNCIPTLLRMIQARDSVVKEAFADLLRKQRFIMIRLKTAFEARMEPDSKDFDF